jgi:hypothetical protein
LSFSIFIICKIITFENSNLFFFYMSKEWKFDSAWNYNKMRPSPEVWKFAFMFVLMLGHTFPNWRTTWVLKHGAKNSQMLMDTENTVYKGKSLHVHRNNKIYILENQNGKHTHCFQIHLKKEKRTYQKHTNPWPKS